MNILLAEDNGFNAEIATGFLRIYHPDLVVDWAKNGAQAVQKYVKNDGHYRIILMDCMMPLKDGFQATREIRQWEIENCAKQTPVLGLTALTSETDRQRCLQAGMDRVLTKPISKKRFFDGINGLQTSLCEKIKE